MSGSGQLSSDSKSQDKTVDSNSVTQITKESSSDVPCNKARQEGNLHATSRLVHDSKAYSHFNLYWMRARIGLMQTNLCWEGVLNRKHTPRISGDQNRQPREKCARDDAVSPQTHIDKKSDKRSRSHHTLRVDTLTPRAIQSETKEGCGSKSRSHASELF